MQRFLRQSEAPEYLGFSEPKFNELVRPHVMVITHGRMVMYDVKDLDEWADRFKAENGKQAEQKQWQKEPPALEKRAKYGTSKKSLAASSFAKALEKRNSSARSVT
jgi:hypothetical protein